MNKAISKTIKIDERWHSRISAIAKKRNQSITETANDLLELAFKERQALYLLNQIEKRITEKILGLPNMILEKIEVDFGD